MCSCKIRLAWNTLLCDTLSGDVNTHTHLTLLSHALLNISATIRVSGNQMSVTALQAVWGFGGGMGDLTHTHTHTWYTSYPDWDGPPAEQHTGPWKYKMFWCSRCQSGSEDESWRLSRLNTARAASPENTLQHDMNAPSMITLNQSFITCGKTCWI